jgi:hypothetical protein
LEELWEVWAWWWRSKGRNRSMVPTVVPEGGGEGRVDGAVLGCFDVEERGTAVEAHAEDAEESVQWRRTWRRMGASADVWRGNDRVTV